MWQYDTFESLDNNSISKKNVYSVNNKLCEKINKNPYSMRVE